MTKKLVTLKVDPQDLERIDLAARLAGQSRTAYILAKALGKTQAQPKRRAQTPPPVDLSRIDVARWGENKSSPGSRLKTPPKKGRRPHVAG